jgi:hypothetical protein
MTIKEIEAKSVLRKFRRIDSWFVAKSGLNLYRGCAHDCAYCDGRAENYRVEGEFGSEVVVKVNAVDVLRRELARGTLALFEALGVPVHVLTKSTLVLRDADILGRMAGVGAAVDAGARYVLFGGMTLKEGRQRDHFLSVLSGVRPDLVPSYRRLYPGDPWGAADGGYSSRIKRIFGELARERRVPPRIPRGLFEGIVSGTDLALVLLEQIHALLELEGKSSRFRHAAFQLSRSKDGAIPPGIGPAAQQAIEEIRRTGTARLYEELLSRFSPGA